MSTARRIKELDDWDRTPEGAKYARLLADWRDAARPMGAAKRIPSPYLHAEPPRPMNTESSAPIAFACFGMLGAIFVAVGGVTIARWVSEAVR